MCRNSIENNYIAEETQIQNEKLIKFECKYHSMSNLCSIY